MTETGVASEGPRGLLGAGIAVTAWSTGTILAKYLDMDALAIGAYRFFVFFIGLTLYMRARGVPFTVQIIRKSVWGGIALGADIVLFFSAIKATSVVNATIIGSLQPILVGAVAARFFGEKIRPAMLSGRSSPWLERLGSSPLQQATASPVCAATCSPSAPCSRGAHISSPRKSPAQR